MAAVTAEGDTRTSFSVSSFITGSAAVILVPGLIIKRTRSPLSIFSPSSGSLNSVAIHSFSFPRALVSVETGLAPSCLHRLVRCRRRGKPRFDGRSSSLWTGETPVAPLADSRVALLRINSKIANCLLQQFRADAFAAVLLLGRLLPRQSMQGGKHNMLCVHFEEISQRRPILAAPETVRAERHQLARNPLSETFRQDLHVIRCRDERAARTLQRLSDVRYFCFLCRVQHNSARAIVRLAIELLVTSHAPHIHRDAV